jgi:hypothetical protein
MVSISSRDVNVINGVPQGCLLGPTLFQYTQIKMFYVITDENTSSCGNDTVIKIRSSHPKIYDVTALIKHYQFVDSPGNITLECTQKDL